MGKAGFVEPMKARLVERPPAGNWIYEIKHDGFRALAIKNGSEVQLISRNQKDMSGKFPEVAAAIGKLKIKDTIIDGEIVAVEPSGKSSFQLLQAYDVGEARPPIRFYAFDLLRLDGKDLTKSSVVQRKARLEKVLQRAPGIILFSESLGGEAEHLMAEASRLGLEGLIGKRADSVYEIGQRSGAWIKLKLLQEQEMVIGGFSKPQGARSYFGALLVGFYEKDKLIFAGKVGTGFNQKSLKAMHRDMTKLQTEACPFANLPERKGSRYSPGMTAAEMRKCTWLKPELVCQVRFGEWTRDGKLRQPVFLGLRADKKAEEVIRETAD